MEIITTNDLESRDILDLTIQLQELQRNECKTHLQIGAILKYIKDAKIYTGLATHIKTWNDYCKETKIGRRKADYCIDIWEIFGEYMNDRLLDIDPTRLIRLIPTCRNAEPEKIKELLHLAANAPTCNDLMNQVSDNPTDNCDHGETEPWSRCKKCNKFMKI